MAVTQPGGRKTLLAGADLTQKQFYVVKKSAGAVVLSSAAGDNHLGVLQNAPANGDTAEVLGNNSNSTGKVVLGGTVADQDKLTSDANGRAVTATAEDAQIIGLAEEAGVVNQVIQYTPQYDVIPPAS